MATGLTKRAANATANKLLPKDRPAHDWYRFVLSYPPHLVRQYLERFELGGGHRVLDPFCGTGTTVVECKRLGIPSVGLEANPMAHFASTVKTDWAVAPKSLLTAANEIAQRAAEVLESQRVPDESRPLLNGSTHRGKATPEALRTLSAEQTKLLLANSISPRPLHKTLVLRDLIREHAGRRTTNHLLLALAKSLVYSTSNLHFGPEVGVGRPKEDAPVVALWRDEVGRMVEDLRELRPQRNVESIVHHADARDVTNCIEAASIDGVITSPPYPNEKDYTRTTRLESVILGFLESREELRQLKKSLIRSNTRGVYKQDSDDSWIAEHPEIDRIAKQIEARRIELGKTSGFERMYARVTKLYFGGMARHFADLRSRLRPGAMLAYVVGDQASYLRVMIRTGQLLAQIAERLGYEVVGIDLFRTRLSTATREQLREEVVVLRWPGKQRGAKKAASARNGKQ